MKDYEIILSTVKRSLKHHSIDYMMGYIYSLLDWCVINLETYNKLEIFIKRERKQGEEKKYETGRIY